MRALICGVGGQDGGYLAKLLVEKGYEVWGTSRDAQVATFSNLHFLGVRNGVKTLSMAPSDFRSVISVLYECEPDEIYFLSAQSSVGLSFDQPAQTLESIAGGTLNLLEAIRLLRKPVRFYHASSSECFGDVGLAPANESTRFAPRSPYAVAKASAHWLVANYREAYKMYACNGILFNHDSPLRPPRFVTRKIISAAHRIASGSPEKLLLGRLDVVRDWGWAPEYVVAMWLMLQSPSPDDFVIATGKAHSLQKFVEVAFERSGLDWRHHVHVDEALFRPNDLAWSQGDPGLAARKLGWHARYGIQDVIDDMLASEQDSDRRILRSE
jgi:GDPmannose 4,6-dehydratase